MDAKKFMKEFARMCNYYTANCDSCPMSVRFGSCEMGGLYIYDMDEIVDIIDKWSIEHPVKTNADKFYEVFGHRIWCNKNLDRDRRAFSIEDDGFGHLMQEDWLSAQYKEK